MSTEPTVFVVDDDPSMRRSLQWLLQPVGLPVESFATAEEFLAAYEPVRAGCLVLDVRMPGMGGLVLQDELAARGVTLPIIVITAYAEVSMAVRALKGGAIDFLEKPFSDQLLVDRVREAIALDHKTREIEQRRCAAAQRVAQLSPRQRQVMDLVIEGQANKVIAQALGIGEKTVEVHRAHLMRKLGINSVAALIQIATDSQGNTGKPVGRYGKFPN